MDRKTARKILKECWVWGHPLTAEQAREIEGGERPGETAFDTCCRVGGVSLTAHDVCKDNLAFKTRQQMVAHALNESAKGERSHA